MTAFFPRGLPKIKNGIYIFFNYTKLILACNYHMKCFIQELCVSDQMWDLNDLIFSCIFEHITIPLPGIIVTHHPSSLLITVPNYTKNNHNFYMGKWWNCQERWTSSEEITILQFFLLLKEMYYLSKGIKVGSTYHLCSLHLAFTENKWQFKFFHFLLLKAKKRKCTGEDTSNRQPEDEMKRDSSTLDSNNDSKIYPLSEISDSESSDGSILILMIFLKFKNQHMKMYFF